MAFLDRSTQSTGSNGAMVLLEWLCFEINVAICGKMAALKDEFQGCSKNHYFNNNSIYSTQHQIIKDAYKALQKVLYDYYKMS